jgi:toxin ParE1/3/4
MSYRLLPQAERDLESIADYIAERNPRAAMHLIERLHERWALLVAHPLTGPARPELNDEARLVVTGNYLTLYRVRQAGIEIVRVLHGRRNVRPVDFA